MRLVTHYEVLGVDRGAAAPDVRRAYVRLARQHHPDFHASDRPAAERRMQRINEAWAVLGDPSRRRQYDRTLAESRGDPGPDPDPGPAASSPLDDDVDWERERDLDLLDDEPISDAQVKGSWTVLPVGLFFTSVALFCLAMVLQAPGLLALAAVVFLVSALSFLVLPFLAMAGSRRRDLSDGRRP
jgi:hypothetical protein